MLEGSRQIEHVDLAYDPYEPIGKRTTWPGLPVESLLNVTVNRLQALLTRTRA